MRDIMGGKSKRKEKRKEGEGREQRMGEKTRKEKRVPKVRGINGKSDRGRE